MLNKVGALVMDLHGLSLSPEEKELLVHPWVGGVILFTRNFESRNQLMNLCQAIRKLKSSLLIMVDQEGGRVQRFRQDFTILPSLGLFGNLYNDNPNQVCHLAKECAWLMASELLSAGVDFSLAPVLDLNKKTSQVIGDRAFHSSPNIVTKLAAAFIQGLHEAGMPSIGKHFPGHGSISTDSHLSLSEDNRSLDSIEKEDMLPFTNMIQKGMTAIMASHIIFPQVDTLPVGFSYVWLKDVLRKRLQFEGIIFTDDLNMEGANISSHYSDRVVLSKEAGSDFVLLCNQRQGVIQILDDLPYDRFMVDKEKCQLLKPKSVMPVNFSVDDSRLKRTRNLLQEINQ